MDGAGHECSCHATAFPECQAKFKHMHTPEDRNPMDLKLACLQLELEEEAKAEW